MGHSPGYMHISCIRSRRKENLGHDPMQTAHHRPASCVTPRTMSQAERRSLAAHRYQSRNGPAEPGNGALRVPDGDYVSLNPAWWAQARIGCRCTSCHMGCARQRKSRVTRSESNRPPVRNTANRTHWRPALAHRSGHRSITFTALKEVPQRLLARGPLRQDCRLVCLFDIRLTGEFIRR